VRCGERRAWTVGEDVSSMVRRWRECPQLDDVVDVVVNLRYRTDGRPWTPFVDVDYTRKPTSHKGVKRQEPASLSRTVVSP
jgi:hypothetical protein